MSVFNLVKVNFQKCLVKIQKNFRILKSYSRELEDCCGHKIRRISEPRSFSRTATMQFNRLRPKKAQIIDEFLKINEQRSQRKKSMAIYTCNKIFDRNSFQIDKITNK